MRTAIEGSLSRLASKVEAIEVRLDAIQKVCPAVSTFAGGTIEHLGDVVAAATKDNRANVAGHLRALHEAAAADSREGLRSQSFGKPLMPPIVIDGEFTKDKGE
ncbi:MAG: hypothetical protein ABSH08_17835 [Tepidisphaeraceae bacterium]|jgi:hypothetical protein